MSKIIQYLLGIVHTLLNPEDRNKRKLQSLYAEYDKLVTKRNAIIHKQLKIPKTDNSLLLGAILSNIVRVRREIDRLKGK